MIQTSYTGIVPLQRNIHYNGGFCRFWYIAVEDIAVFPRINPENQKLVAEPSLKAGKAWFGPIKVPRDKIGFTEEMKRVKAGPYYEHKVEGVHIGDSPESRVNLENMPYHRYVVVGKLRAGGSYLVIGTIDSPCRFDASFQSGRSAGETALTVLQFTNEHINKAYIMPAFTADTISPGIGGEDPEEEIMANQKEIISFEEQATISIPWTPARLQKFGSFPEIEVYIQEDGGVPIKSGGGSIEADQPPPAFTELSVKLGGNPTGFIVIS